MPTYWSQVVGQLAAQRARWIEQYARKSSASQDISGKQPAAAGRAGGADAALGLENAQLKREVAALSAHVAQLERLVQTRAAQIECLIAALRHLRAERRRWSSLSSIEGPSSSASTDREADDADATGDLRWSRDDDDRSDELSVTFTHWSESGSSDGDEDQSVSTAAVETASL